MLIVHEFDHPNIFFSLTHMRKKLILSLRVHAHTYTYRQPQRHTYKGARACTHKLTHAHIHVCV